MLRPPVATMGPLLPSLRTDLALNAVETGLLTSLPVLCFGAGAFASAVLVRKFGIDRTMTLLLLVLILGVGLRPWFGFAALLICSVAIGLAIAVANVILPTVVRERYPKHVLLITAAYTMILSASASLASAIAVPLSGWLGGWKSSMFFWLFPAAVAILLWLAADRTPIKPTTEPEHLQRASSLLVLKSKITWGLTLFFGLQSLGFYAMLGWMPTLLISRGFDATTAGNLLALTAVIGLPVGFALTAVYRKAKQLGWYAVAASAITASGFVVLSVDPKQALLACILLGVGQQGTFPLSLALISTKASTAEQTTLLSSIVQGIGYLIAAAGTLIFGNLGELLGWAPALCLLVALTGIQAAAALVAGGRSRIPAAG